MRENLGGGRKRETRADCFVDLGEQGISRAPQCVLLVISIPPSPSPSLCLCVYVCVCMSLSLSVCVYSLRILSPSSPRASLTLEDCENLWINCSEYKHSLPLPFISLCERERERKRERERRPPYDHHTADPFIQRSRNEERCLLKDFRETSRTLSGFSFSDR